MKRWYTMAVAALLFAACGGSDDGSNGNGNHNNNGGDTPYLTWNGTLKVEGGKQATVQVKSNELFTVEASDTKSCTFSWGPTATYAVDYPQETLNCQLYKSKLAGPEAAERIVEITFDDDSVAKLIIQLVAGGTCDESIECGGQDVCMQNAADFPVCNCALPYRPSGFDCAAPRSCVMPSNRCIDYTGEYWVDAVLEMGHCAAQGGTPSEASCAPPSGTVLTGTCLIQAYTSQLNSGTSFYYYSYDALAARTTCETVQGGIWMPVTP